jgi:tetratricopeptide (TPR) repeat protein
MPNLPPPDRAVEPDPGSIEENFYEIPKELAAGPGDPGDGPVDVAAPARRARPGALKLAIAVGAVLALGSALLIYRAHAHRQAIQDAIARAEELMRQDTATGYRQAAELLRPLAEADPLQSASARAFALSMLAADYRDAQAEAEAEALLVAPSRAEEIPPHATLALAALALKRNVLGDATAAASGAAGTPWADVLQARIALRAGTMPLALESAEQAARAGFTAGRALEGDLLRRERRDPAAAREAYEKALSDSPNHPRAAYGLAKLALSGHAPASQRATEALLRVSADEATPAAERSRARLHLAALLLRTGDRAGADATLDQAGLDPSARTWAGRAAAAEAANRGPFRGVSGAPAALVSASDDDPAELRPLAPEPPRAEAPKRMPAKTAIHSSRAKATRKATTARSTSKPPKSPAKSSRRSRAHR